LAGSLAIPAGPGSDNESIPKGIAHYNVMDHRIWPNLQMADTMSATPGQAEPIAKLKGASWMRCPPAGGQLGCAQLQNGIEAARIPGGSR